MANIPVERTGGTPWWLWLLGLLLLIGLIWFLADLFSDDEDEVDDLGEDVEVFDDGIDDDLDTDMVEELPMNGALTSLAMLANADELIGREVDLEGVRVTSLAGDSTFFVTQPSTGSDRQALVVLEGLGEWRNGPGDGSDGAYDINVGNVLDIEGEIVRYNPGAPGTSQLAGADAERVLREGIYIRAENIDKE